MPSKSTCACSGKNLNDNDRYVGSALVFLATSQALMVASWPNPYTPCFSAQVHAFFNALHDLEDMADKPSSNDLDLCRPDECLRPVIRISNQSFDIYPHCYHRTFHTRRLTVQNPDSLNTSPPTNNLSHNRYLTHSRIPRQKLRQRNPRLTSQRRAGQTVSHKRLFVAVG